ncbi:MAG: SufD family Fe-S cluster assembly protein, partial [Proteobacteria bacterium]|nr:SufD family Fe-S cluster assembly protein [Pseudomonadota bacterium]
MHDIDNDSEVNLDNYEVETEEHEYIDELSRIDSSDADKFLDVGVDTKEMARAGTFIQKDKSVIHCKTKLDGVEVMGISQARKKYEWLGDYMWKSISPDTDKFTSQAKEKPHEGYF